VCPSSDLPLAVYLVQKEELVSKIDFIGHLYKLRITKLTFEFLNGKKESFILQLNNNTRFSSVEDVSQNMHREWQE
jgi:hypothetical protein